MLSVGGRQPPIPANSSFGVSPPVRTPGARDGSPPAQGARPGSFAAASSRSSWPGWPLPSPEVRGSGAGGGCLAGRGAEAVAGAWGKRSAAAGRGGAVQTGGDGAGGGGVERAGRARRLAERAYKRAATAQV